MEEEEEKAEFMWATVRRVSGMVGDRVEERLRQGAYLGLDVRIALGMGLGGGRKNGPREEM